MLRIAIPTDNGLLSSHFGRAPSFSIFEVDEEDRTIVRSSNLSMGAHTDCNQITGRLLDEQVRVVIAGGIGQGAVNSLRFSGIELWAGAPPAPPEQLVQQYLAGELAQGEARCVDDGQRQGHHHRHGRGSGDR